MDEKSVKMVIAETGPDIFESYEIYYYAVHREVLVNALIHQLNKAMVASGYKKILPGQS